MRSICVVLVTVFFVIGSAAGQSTDRVSLGWGWSQANSGNFADSRSAISSGGRYVVFNSYANNLVLNDTNSEMDAFWRDNVSGVVKRVSVDSNGVQGNGLSIYSAISSDGKIVAFDSYSTNLVANDTNGFRDIFVHGIASGATRIVTVNNSGQQANGDSFVPVLNADGRFVAFTSEASNLVANDTNGARDAFVHSGGAGIERVSVSTANGQGNNASGFPSISADGRMVAFESWASNLVKGDTNGQCDCFVRDRWAGTTIRVSLGGNGQEANGGSHDCVISADGSVVAFTSAATNLAQNDLNGTYDVFVFDLVAASVERVSVDSHWMPGNAMSLRPTLSAQGRYVAFESDASNLVSGDANSSSDVFVRDRLTRTTTRVSVASNGAEGNAMSRDASIDTTGQYIAFTSMSTNLVSNDTNWARDVFLRTRTREVPPDDPRW